MKFRHWLFISVLGLLPTVIFSQGVLEFTQAKITGDSKTVYFHIKGLSDDESERSALLENLLSDENVLDGRIFTSSSFKTRCQLFLTVNITAEYIRSILNTNGYDFDFTTVSIDGKLKEATDPETFVSMFYLPVEDFPSYVETGNRVDDDENYRVAKEAWVFDNSKKYNKEKSKGTAEYPITVSKEDFNKYSQEKQQRLLAEPDKYIIK